MEDNVICPLCLHFQSEIAGDYFVVCLPCGHVYHNYCIMDYLLNGKQNCPTCNTPVHPRKLTKLYGIDPNSEKLNLTTPPLPISSPISTNKSSRDAYNYMFKLVLLGCSGVGKTSLCKRFADNTFMPNINATRGVDLVRKNVQMGDVKVQLIIWDTIGQETFSSITSTCVRDVQGILFVYDVTKPQTLKDLQYWFDFANSYGPKDCVKILVGNQVDLLDKRVPSHEGKAVADTFNFPFYETSAKSADNIEAVFRMLTAKILENEWIVSAVKSRMTDPTTIRLRANDEDSEPGCLSWLRRGWQSVVEFFDKH